MKNVIKIALIAAFSLTCLSSCFQAPTEMGYLGENIYLKGADTMPVTIGSKARSDIAWLDNSTQPCHFEIVSVKKENADGTLTANDQFMQTFPVMLWKTPYDYLTDKTVEQVLAKISEEQKAPIIINEVNGQLIALETTSEIEGLEDGDVYHVDVMITNSKGSKLLEDYAIIKFTASGEATDYYLREITNGISIVADDPDGNGTPYNYFPFYDQQDQTANTADFDVWLAALRAGVGNDGTPGYYETKKGQKVLMRDHLRKVSNEPTTGIVFKFKFVDDNGDVFTPSDYTTYSEGTQSYIDYATGRVDTDEWMELSFPITPWPVNADLRSYLKGKVNDNFDNLDVEALKKANLAGEIPYNTKWSDKTFASMTQWYVRLRSMIVFYEPGTYEMWVEVPFTTAK
ncbi:MAG: DUF5007 domain-containing protein [Rikenellaceae bacterium]|nr:DUF5007 domain-containing protein [Rikenellaceae bacterium]